MTSISNMENKMRVIDSLWFHSLDMNMGIVVAEDDFARKAYIGVGFGVDQGEDEIHILNFGAQFPLKAADVLFSLKPFEPKKRSESREKNDTRT